MTGSLRGFLGAMFVVAAVACSSGSGGSADVAVAPDAAGDDATADVVALQDASDVTPSDVAVSSDGEGDAAPEVTADVYDPAACEPVDSVPQDEPDPAQSKFALALFHFNLQYVAGGLEFVDDDGNTVTLFPGSSNGWDNEAVEDWIIRETFEPVVDFYLDHPDWKVNFELQAYMIEVIAERFPPLIGKLRTLTQRGQMELMSFHYSDQLFLAFPREDLRRSIVETKAIFARYCLPLAPSVFNQEGQAGEGRQAMLVDEGYQIGVFPKNLWRYLHGDGPRWPYYASKGGDLIVGPGDVDPESGIEVSWLFLDDGELLAPTEGMDPYFATVATYDPNRLVQWEQKIQEKVDQGYRISHVSDYVRHLKARDLEQPEAPPLLDGTWQPPSTDSIHRWLGGRGNVWWTIEKDNAIRTENVRVRHELLMAQTLRDYLEAEGADTAAIDPSLHQAWRDLWLAQVSDATGINPWLAEIVYGERHNAAALHAVQDVMDDMKELLGTPYVQIDTADGTVETVEDIPQAEPPAPADPQLAVTVKADGRTVDEQWFESGMIAEHYELRLIFPTAEDAPGDADDPRWVEVCFPRTEDRILYSPGLLDDELVDYGFEEFAWTEGEVYLPLANGLIGLGDDIWLLKDTRAVHIAARLRPDNDQICFIDEVAPMEAFTWVFHVLPGTAAEALALADRLNVHPFGFR